MRLNWNGRATQARSITESEWEKHKPVICQLRPLMSLGCLMNIMERDHNFTASRPQYKSRFRKWQLPRLRTVSTPDEPQNAALSAQQSQPLDWPLPMTPINILPREFPVEFLAAPLLDSSAFAGTERQSSQRAILPIDVDWGWGVEITVRNNGPKTPKPQKQLHSNHSTNAVLSVPRPTSDQLQSDTDTGYGEAVTAQDLLCAKERCDIVNMLTFQDIRNIAEAAHFLFAVGSNQVAHDLFSMLWKALLVRKHVPIPLLVSAIVEVARSSFRREQLNAAQLAIANLLVNSKDNLTFFPEAELTLRAQLADVLRRLTQVSQASDDGICALRHISDCSNETENVLNDQRGLGSPLSKSSTRILDRYKESAANANCSCYHRLERATCWKIKQSHNEAFRFIFTWCAARLLDAEVHEKLSEVFGRWSYYNWDETKIVREIGTLVFCHIWTTYTKAKILVSEEGVSEVVPEICGLMGISSAEMFAGMSLLLVSSKSRWSRQYEELCEPYTHNRSWSYYIPQLLRHVQECALDLLLAHDSQPSFMWTFLDACVFVNTTSLPSPCMDTEYYAAFIKEHSTIALSFSISPILAIAPMSNKSDLSTTGRSDVQSVPFDPTLSRTPRSSQSSGLASMLSLQRKVARKKDEAQIGRDSIGSGQNRSSWSSGSLRRQMGLSMASYRTMSTDDSDSLHGSVMDWEPAIHKIQEGIAI
ncbi:hypothetical protein GJ744_000338 [Endocarpon pusillum]|uniref:Clr5 domain-containing protein n=1 Tax=Endocarpon pusillum TaxID=364733 RepID=A0A8H7EAJ6_9EURO|nr:hypothetical protein GJ744_000338 [Endocarpon pusillum]